jgi:CDP-diacylglycerol--glycerol-3-phosphate 3-phosphatidyltransferase
MANFITIFRVFLVFISVYLLLDKTPINYLVALFLVALAFAMDGLDGYVARKFNETSKLGAVLDIMSDRIAENTYWITFIRTILILTVIWTVSIREYRLMRHLHLMII